MTRIEVVGLKELPDDCTRIKTGEYGRCPCLHEATQDGPEYCTLMALIRKDYFNSKPSKEHCPLRYFIVL